MSADMHVMVALLDLPVFWEGVLTAILGISFWIIALGILYLLYERYSTAEDSLDDT